MRTAVVLRATPTEGRELDRAESEARLIAGLRVTVATAESAAATLEARLDGGIPTALAFLNAHCVNLAFESAEYRKSLDGFMILPDGIGVDLASLALHGSHFPENLNGTDFVPFLLSRLARPLRVALIGAAPGIVERAADAFAKQAPHHTYLPIAHGYFAAGAETEAVLSRLRAARADIVLVALGVPTQELFIARHIGGREATVAIAVGALLDFMAGKVPRAPRVMRNLRLEWVYRLMMEPRRLWRRYLLGNPRFILHILAERRRVRADKTSG